MRYTKSALMVALIAALTACSGGGTDTEDGIGNNGNGDIQWVQGQFIDAAIFKSYCALPRAGSKDLPGSALHEKMWLRSWTNNTYLWYSEVADNDPQSYSSVNSYFKALKTEQTTATGAPKDRFHFSMSSEEWDALAGSGESLGYGMDIKIISGTVPREVVVTYTEPGSEAAIKGVRRGSRFIDINGVDVVNAQNQSEIDVLNAALFPSEKGKVSSFKVREPDGTERSFSFSAATVVQVPVHNVKTLNTATGKVGYMQFNSHIVTSELALVEAIGELKSQGIEDLVVDLRYNGGGYLAIASQLGYMVAGLGRTNNKVFEQTRFNDKHTSKNPVTGETLTAMPFINTGIGLSFAEGKTLPSLGLPRVFVLTGAGTCSASEAIINGLRGIDVEVIQIGDGTCGKPYGFYPAENCGTTYFSIQFRGENNKGFGDYAAGFEPVNTPGLSGEPVPGCQVADDFDHSLGDPAEALLAAALQYRSDGSCPALPAMAYGAKFAPRAFGTGPELNDPRSSAVFMNNRIITKIPVLR